MDQKKKIELNKRIVDSVLGYRKRKLRRRMTLAASTIIFLVVGAFVWRSMNGQDDSNIELIQHARSVKVDMGSESEVKLVLGEEEVLIGQDNAQVSYSSSGDSVLINNSKNVNQRANKDRIPIYNTIVVPYGNRSQVVLSDGSKIWLNAGTKLTYPAVFMQKKREVYLQGEAIFEVAHNKSSPFQVVTEDYVVEVLGTVFNVSSYPDDNFTNTALKSGSVRINLPDHGYVNKEVVMVPGTLTSYNRSKKHIKTEKEDIDRYMSWRNGSFIFDNSTLEYIVKKIARHYNAPIVIADKTLGKRKFSGSLNIDKSLENTLDILKETAGLEYDKTDNQIYINQTN